MYIEDSGLWSAMYAVRASRLRSISESAKSP